MKKITRYLPLIFLIVVLINPVFGYPQMSNKSIAQPLNTTVPDLNNMTRSDQDIVLLQQLIEVDAVQFESADRLYVRETLIFKNVGTKNFSGTLRTWVPDGLEGIRVGKIEMMTNAQLESLTVVQNGNIISWQDRIDANTPLPPLYALEYVIVAEPKGSLTKSKYYSKKLVYPTLINKLPGNVVLKVTKNKGDGMTITDENGDSIQASGSPREDGNSVIYTWDAPQFKELKIELSRSAINASQIAIFLIIGLLIVLALSYPRIREKSEKLQAFEEKVKDYLKREPDEESEEKEEETVRETVEEPEEETETELAGKETEELESEKNEILAKLDELEKEYSSGNLMDEEYEELRGPLQEKLKKINRKPEQ